VNTVAATYLNNTLTVYAGGAFVDYNLLPYNYIVKLDANGSIDSATTQGVGVSAGTVEDILPLTNGFEQFLVAGNFTFYNGTFANALFLIGPNASPVSGFSIGSGFAGNNDTVYSVAQATDGSGDIFAGGSFSTFNGTTVNDMVRMTSTGEINNNFTVSAGFNNTVYSVLPAPGGTGVYAGGLFTTFQGNTQDYLVKLTSTGALDTTFTGLTTGFNGQVNAIIPVGDGTNDIYVGGSFTQYNGVAASYLVRLTSSGSVSTTDNFSSLGFNGAVQTLATDGDGAGTVYVGGAFTKYNNIANNHIIRLKNSGAADTSFAPGTGYNGTVFSIAVALVPPALTPAPSNNIWVGGAFTTFQGSSAVRINSLTSAGANVPAFSSGVGPNNTVDTIAPVLDGTTDILVGGSFTSYNNSTTDTAIRLNNNGTLY
jgi:hypothetical protein